MPSNETMADHSKSQAADEDRFEVLIIEESDSQRKKLMSRLQELGVKYHCASDANEALEVIEANAIRLIISMQTLSGMTGLDFCRHVRKLDLDRYIQIILTAPEVSQTELIDAINSGADDLIASPLNLDYLEARLFCANRNAQLELTLKKQRNHLRELYDRLEEEVGAAADLQAELMPQDGRYEQISVHSYFVPAAIVSGDCQNHFKLTDGRILAYQADIVGHGLRAALLSATLQRVLTPSFCCWRDGTVLGAAEIVLRLNQRLLSRTDPPEYFTLFLTITDPETGRLSFCQAGHPSPALRHGDGSIEWIGDGGFPVGMLAGAEFENGSIVLEPGAKLMLMSDGVLECSDKAGVILGSEQLDDMFKELSWDEGNGGGQTEGQLLARLTEWHGGNEFLDDVSILSINRAKDDPANDSDVSPVGRSANP